MIINGTDLVTLGWKPARGRQVPRFGGEQTQHANIPGGIGGVRLGGDVHAGTMIIPGQLRADTPAALRASADSLAALLRGELVIRLSDFADREWVGWLQQASGLTEIGPDYASTAADVRLEFRLPDPTARAQAETTIPDSGALVLGTAPSPLRVTITNDATAAITQVIVRVRAGGAGGTILTELQWDGNLAVSNVLVIDAGTFSVTNDGANGIDGLTAASEFPIADPAEGADYVELAITGGPTQSREIAYRPRWW